MKLNEAQEILAKHGFKMQLNECGGYSGPIRRPEKPSPDAVWVDGCYGGHWHVPTEQDKRRAAYRDKKNAAIGGSVKKLQNKANKLNNDRKKRIDDEELKVKTACVEYMDKALPTIIAAKFKNGWKVENLKMTKPSDHYIGYTFVASKDGYSWNVTAERFLGGSYGWQTHVESPAKQRIPRDAEKNSSYYANQIRSCLEKVNSTLNKQLSNKIDNYDADVDTDDLDSQIDNIQKQMYDMDANYDEENGWDRSNSEYKDNLTKTGRLKKTIVRHESTEVDDAKQLLERAGFICENATQEQIAYCEEVVKAWAAMYKRKTGTNHFGWCYTKDEKESAIYALADLVEEDIGDKIDYSVDPKVTAKQFYAEITHLSDY